MIRTIEVTTTHHLLVNIDDYALSQRELEAFVKKMIEDEGIEFDDSDYEWIEGYPRVSEMSPEPPPHCWVKVEGIEVATNGHLLITRDCPVRPANTTAMPWLPLHPDRTDRIGDTVRKALSGVGELDFHHGFFSEDLFGSFKGLEKLEALETKTGAALLMQDGKMIAICLSPGSFRGPAFQFHEYRSPSLVDRTAEPS